MYTIISILLTIAVIGALFNFLISIFCTDGSGVYDGDYYDGTEQEPKPKSRGRKTRTRSREVPTPEYAIIEEEQTELHTTPSIKEYVLPDGSKVAVDTEETQVTETKAMPIKSPAERFGGGMAEIIRKRREAEVF